MSNRAKAEMTIFMITAIWGSSFIIMKNLLDDIPVFTYLTLRFAVASVALFFIFFRSLRIMKKRTLVLGIAIGLMLFLGMSLQVYGLKYTTASRSAFITGLNVVMVPVISSVFLKKKPGLNSLIGVMLAVGGLFFLSGGLQGRYNIGDILTLLCAFCFAFQIILVDYSVAKEDAGCLALIQVIFAAAACALVWAGTEKGPVAIDIETAAAIIFTGLFATAFAFGGQTFAQKYTTPTRTALIITFEPVFAAVFAAVIPNNSGMTEKLSQAVIIGCLLIFSGMVTAVLRPLRSRYFSS